MESIAFYDKQHLQMLLAQQNNIANAFNLFCQSVSINLRRWSDTGNKSVWVRNLAVEKAIERNILELQTILTDNIESYQTDAWNRSNLKNDDLVKGFIDGMAIKEVLKNGMFVRNMDALVSLQNRVDNGMNLSKRIWNMSDNTKTQLEFYLKSGLSIGRSAAGISQDLKNLLEDPDRMFHRIRNDEGRLVPSQPMKDFHPGTGQYKSQKMNMMRLAATETNMAYRKADHARWAGLDFILGIDIQRSPSAKEPCKVCDPMAGKYPKTFQFTGWHPWCICFATPVMMNPADFANYLITGNLPQSQVIRSIPASAKEYISDNLDSINASQPYWLQDNFGGDASNVFNY